MTDSTANDIFYMRRALALASHGRGFTSPNPMVGAVVVGADGRVLGEGWHRRYGGPHAEVNALASVPGADRHLLPQATIFVTLEPCSHYGKTPPCAGLIMQTGLRRVVVGCGDPNPRVAGAGIDMLRRAGIEVTTGVLEKECYQLNIKFMTAHRRGLPWVTLKWAQSADGFMDGHISIPRSSRLVHERRALADAIIVGAGTVLADNPRLTVRMAEGTDPRPIVLDRHNLLKDSNLQLMQRPETIHVADGRPLRALLEELYRNYGYISVLVEGGASVLAEFIDQGLWDEAFVEQAPRALHGKVPAPRPTKVPAGARKVGPNTVYHYLNDFKTEK